MADNGVDSEPQHVEQMTAGPQAAFEELERGVHVAFEDQIQSVPADPSPAWPDWMEAHRQSQLAGGGVA